MSFSDIFSNQEHILPKGLQVKVIRMNAADPVHGVVLGDTLYKVINEEAKAHGELFDGGNFDSVLAAIKSNKIQAHFLIINGTDALPKVVGGAIQFPTVFTKWNGKKFIHYPAVYSEDTYVSKEASATFRRLTTNSKFPHGIGLGTYFVCERIRLSASGENEDMPFGLPARCRIAEHASGNEQIMGIYKKLHATQEIDRINTVLQFEGFLPHLTTDQLEKVQIYSLGSHKGALHKDLTNVFVITWSSGDGVEHLAASFTEAISTFSGAPTVRVQLASSGGKSFRNEASLRAAISAILSAGEKEIISRGWIDDRSNNIFSYMKLHGLHEPCIVNALRDMGAITRLLGIRPMQPTVIDFRNIPSSIFGHSLPVAEPFYCRPTSVIQRLNIPIEARFPTKARQDTIAYPRSASSA